MILIATCGILNDNFLERSRSTLSGLEFDPEKYKHIFVVNNATPEKLKSLKQIFPKTPIIYTEFRLGNFHSNLFAIQISRIVNLPIYLTEEDYTWDLNSFDITPLKKFKFPVHILNEEWEEHFLKDNGYYDNGYLKGLYGFSDLDYDLEYFIQSLDRCTKSNYNNEGYFIPAGFKFNRSDHEIKTLFGKLLSCYNNEHLPNDEFLLYLLARNSTHYKYFTSGVFHSYERDMVGKSNFIDNDPDLFLKNYGVKDVKNWKNINFNIDNYDIQYDEI